MVELNDLHSWLHRFIALFLLLNALEVPRLYHHLLLLFLFLVGFKALVFEEFEERLLGLRAVFLRPEDQVLVVGEDLRVIHWIEFLFLLLCVLVLSFRIFRSCNRVGIALLDLLF